MIGSCLLPWVSTIVFNERERQMKYFKQATRLMGLEFIANAKELVQYRKSVISEILSFFVAFILIRGFSDLQYFADTYGATGTEAVLHILTGFAFWNFGNVAMSYAATVITGDARTGLLENKAQAIVPYYLLVFSDMLVSLFVGMATFMLAEGYLMLTGQLLWGDLLPSLVIFPFMLPAIIGMYGIGLIFGGIAFKEKTIGQYISLFSILLIFISDIFGSEQMSFSFLVPFFLGHSADTLLYRWAWRGLAAGPPLFRGQFPLAKHWYFDF